MNDLRVTQVGGAHDILHGRRGETLLEEAVHVAAEDGFEQRLLLEPGDKLQGGFIRMLLHFPVAPFLAGRIGHAGLVGFRQFLRDAHQVSALVVRSFHFVLVERRRIKGHMDQHHDREALGHLGLHLFQLGFREIVIDIVHGNEIDPIDNAARKGEVIRERFLDRVVGHALVGLVLLRLPHVLRILMVAGTDEPVAFDHVLGVHVQIGLGDKVVQVTGMHEVHALFPGDPDGFVQIVLAGIHVLATPGRKHDLPLVVAGVGPGDMGVGNMHHVERLFQADLDRHFLDVQRIEGRDIPGNPFREPGPCLYERPLVRCPGSALGGTSRQGEACRGRPGYFDEISSVHFLSFSLSSQVCAICGTWARRHASRHQDSRSHRHRPAAGNWFPSIRSRS